MISPPVLERFHCIHLKIATGSRVQHFSNSYGGLSEVWYFLKCHYIPNSCLSVCVINDNDCQDTPVD